MTMSGAFALVLVTSMLFAGVVAWYRRAGVMFQAIKRNNKHNNGTTVPRHAQQKAYDLAS